MVYDKTYKVVSLFSGCGGLDLGFKQAGFNIIFHNEIQKFILPTLSANFHGAISCSDIRKLNIDSIPDSDVIIGGPPCQSFSVGGKMRGEEDSRGKLIYLFSEIVVKKQPKSFLMENVSGLISKRNKKTFDSIINYFENGGYNISWKLIDVYNYGVPQNRKRIFVVGIRKDLKKTFLFPDETHESQKINLEIIKDVKSKNVYEGGFSSIFMSRNRVRKWHEPSFTIQACARQIPLHPSCEMKKVDKDKFEITTDAKRLSVEECAKIQTFPEDFKFIFSRVEHAYSMIGNAVPVTMSRILAINLFKLLNSDK